MKAGSYYFVLRCIKSCKTAGQIDACERMINNLTCARFADDLANVALLKRCELLTTRYSITE